MAIQMRRGLRKDFDPNKMLPGEWAVSIDSVTSNQIVWMCFAAGVCKRMGTYEDFTAQIAEATEDIRVKYANEFSAILADIQESADTVAEDKETVVIVKSDIVNTYLPQIQTYVNNAQTAAATATSKATSASNSATAAKTSETNAKTSETNAKTSETNAVASANAAKTSETNALNSANSASAFATTATQQAENASNSASSAKEYSNTANTHATTASTKASEASTSANKASIKANSASESAILAESYAHGGTGTRENEGVDNAQYYKEQAERISQGLSGALLPMGTITFSQLASQTKQAGYMYNISDSFTTDSTFKEGAGYTYPEGTNVYYTADGYWDCLAGTNVTGVKGGAESSYRRGYVNITKENIGLDKVPNVETNKQTPTFSKASERSNIVSGEELSTIMGKIMKWLDDLTEAAFTQIISSYEDMIANEASGYLPDALAVKEGLNAINRSFLKTDIQWNPNLHVLYNDYEATIYCTDAVYISNLAVGSSIVPAATTKAPCLYKDSSGKWHQGIIQYTPAGNFIVQYFTDYPGTSASTATDTGYVIFEMSFRRA